MPQLWTETMVSQYFWLIAIFFTLYIITATKIVPQISYAIKSRRFFNINTTKSSLEAGHLDVYGTKSFLSSVLIPGSISRPEGSQKEDHNFTPLFDSACSKWARSFKSA